MMLPLPVKSLALTANKGDSKSRENIFRYPGLIKHKLVIWLPLFPFKNLRKVRIL